MAAAAVLFARVKVDLKLLLLLVAEVAGVAGVVGVGVGVVKEMAGDDVCVVVVFSFWTPLFRCQTSDDDDVEEEEERATLLKQKTTRKQCLLKHTFF